MYGAFVMNGLQHYDMGTSDWDRLNFKRTNPYSSLAGRIQTSFTFGEATSYQLWMGNQHLLHLCMLDRASLGILPNCPQICTSDTRKETGVTSVYFPITVLTLPRTSFLDKKSKHSVTRDPISMVNSTL